MISPVIATSLRIGIRVTAERMDVAIVMPADGPSFGIAPFGDVDVDVLLLVEVGLGAVELGPRPHVRERRAGRLLHDVAELAGQDEVSLAAHERRLDVEDVAAGLRPGEAGREADLGLLALLAQPELRLAEEPGEVVGVTVTGVSTSLPMILRAIFRQTDAISRSRLRTPASRVYFSMSP